MVLILTKIRVKVLLRSRLPSDISQSYMGRKFLAVTAALELVAVKVFLILRDRGDTLRMLKQTLKGLSSSLPSTSI